MLDAAAWQALAQGLLAGRAGAVVVLAYPSGQALAQVGRCDEARPPGSALKPLWALRLAQEGLAPAGRTWRCQGALVDAAGVRHLCWKPGGHGELGLEQAVAQSCNLAALRWGEALGPRLMGDTWALAGFAAWRAWPQGGQGARPAGLVLGEAPATWLSPRSLAAWAGQWAAGGPAWAPAAAKGRLRSAMALAASPLGTAHAASRGPWRVAAKTGTASWGPKPGTLGWCWGWAPLDRPLVSFAVVVPGQGSSHAAPLVGALLKGGARPPKAR